MRRFSVCLLLALAQCAFGQEEDLRVMSGWKQHELRWIELPQPGSMLLRRLNAFAFRALGQRDQLVNLLHTAADWQSRREQVRRTLNEILGPWRERTPLHARVMGVIRRDGYRLEKLVYESQPGFHVTAVLYVPDGRSSPRPGIVFIPGHSLEGFRTKDYQNVCLNLVQKGFVVLAYDPIDQGERLQNIDPETGKPFVTAQQVEHYKMHSYFGNQCYLTGVSVARYFIWDGMRGIDYLISRPEVDGSRIGVTGLSGGGTMSVFLGAMDDRVEVTVPACFVTSYRRMLAINGIQDAEQNIFGGLTRGIEHADWLLARAPKPTLLLLTTNDAFPIQGARETAWEVRRAYKALGAEDKFYWVEDDHGHGYTRKNREASYDFLMKHLGVSGDPAEREYSLSRPEELQITPSGQVATSFKSETVWSLNRREALPMIGELKEAREDSLHLVRAVESARELTGYELPRLPSDAVLRGGYRRTGYRIEKYALLGGENEAIPLVLGLPEGYGRRPAVICLHPGGKAVAATPGGPLDDLVRQGFLVAAPDLAGTGEIALAIGRQNDHNAPFYTGMLTRHSVVGLQATDLVRILAWLQSRDDVQPDKIGVLAMGSMGPTAAHAAAFAPSIAWLGLEETPVSYASMVTERFYVFPTSCMVAGALTAYDLPDLLASIAPRKMALVRPVDQAGAPLSDADLRRILAYPLSVYSSRQLRDRLRLLPAGAGETIADIAAWCSR
jgi:dienelactone hydrolase